MSPKKRNAKILVVDDEIDMCRMLQRMLERVSTYSVITANDGFEAIKIISEWHPDVVITDVKMAGMDGLSLLRNIIKNEPFISVIVITGFATVEMAVEAVKLGAYDFIEKPFDNTKLMLAVERGVERTLLLKENEKLSSSLLQDQDSLGIIGNSLAIKKVRSLIRQIADTDETVLIRGESGTGKELAARAIHKLSKRGRRPLITVNCPAVPEHILESELFGYARGAFTGATHDKKGLFLEAEGSSILLDEIGDIPVSIQTKLLRVLQEKEIRPLGTTKDFKVNVRVIASTNRDLEQMISEGSFREDLFFRLNVITVDMPPLRSIREDILVLAHHFLKKYAIKYNKNGISFSEDALICMTQKQWKGNVRELENVVKRAVLLNQTGTITVDDIGGKDEGDPCAPCGDAAMVHHLLSKPYNVAKKELVARFSVKYIEKLLSRTKGNVTEAAKLGGMERQALQRLLRRYGIKSSHFKEQNEGSSAT